VLPLHRQHPIRGAFLDPRAHDRLGAVYHNGIDIAVRDDRPGRGAPAGRTHRVHAIEGGRVTNATAPGHRGLVDIGHFRYEHVDARVRVGQRVEAGQPIGRILARDEAAAGAAADGLLAALRWSERPGQAPPLVHEVVLG
jgi:murein DD-endopeptidase MepM/ murein hydrolase activator NlpD